MAIMTKDGGGVWVNIYKTQTVEGDEIYWTGSVGYSTKENASTDLADKKHYIATIDIKQALCSIEKITVQAHQLGNQGYRIHNQRKTPNLKNCLCNPAFTSKSTPKIMRTERCQRRKKPKQ